MMDLSSAGLIASIIISIISYIIVHIFFKIIDIDLEKKIKYIAWISVSLILSMLYNFIF